MSYTEMKGGREGGRERRGEGGREKRGRERGEREWGRLTALPSVLDNSLHSEREMGMKYYIDRLAWSRERGREGQLCVCERESMSRHTPREPVTWTLVCWRLVKKYGGNFRGTLSSL